MLWKELRSSVKLKEKLFIVVSYFEIGNEKVFL